MRLLPHRVRGYLYAWAGRYSGYYRHLNEYHPPIGYLDWGDVRFTIKTVTFAGGKMHVTAEAGTTEAGQVRELVTVLGTDVQPALFGMRDADMGIKLPGSTWKFTWDCNLSRLSADDRPDAPQPA